MSAEPAVVQRRMVVPYPRPGMPNGDFRPASLTMLMSATARRGDNHPMATVSDGRRVRRWRSILLLLVVLPFLPELAIRMIAGMAAVGGCVPGDAAPCVIATVSLGDLLRRAIEASVAIAMALGFGGIVVWLTLVFVAIQRGFATLPVRLVLAFMLTVVFALWPYLAPGLAIADLVHADCRPHEAGVGACRLYGTAMGRAANETQVVQWFAFLAGPVAMVMFAIYAFVAAARPPATVAGVTPQGLPPAA